MGLNRCRAYTCSEGELDRRRSAWQVEAELPMCINVCISGGVQNDGLEAGPAPPLNDRRPGSRGAAIANSKAFNIISQPIGAPAGHSHGCCDIGNTSVRTKKKAALAKKTPERDLYFSRGHRA